ncbi:hypothetical protein DEQ92_18100 [Haloferax sp. Atlit-6N]|uniref:hypothetical protein n=1 Tax=Haloferax sp. Atlit-6N TaxID=2077205 RepID=UPI000E2628C9|nr:hypothetical protein [Haloferax sp. Atlit-6N]REA01262.1 hypothetical protein DEQ92_18100 [Haloferax sp. Atlit-6N]
MTLLTVVSNVADELNADGAVENRARTLVASLDEQQTNGRTFEATATASLVIARDEHVSRQIQRIESESDDIQQIQLAIEHADSPTERSRILNNLRHVIDDERIQRLLQRRLTDVAEKVEDEYGFTLKTVVENVRWSA